VTPAEIALAAARGVHLAATLSFAGALVFRLVVAPYPLGRVLRPSLAVAMLAGLAWLVLQAADLAEASNLAEAAAAVPVTALHTRFGRMLLLRLALLPVAAIAAGSGNGRLRLVIGATLGVAAVAIEAALGHVAASGSPLLITSLALHLIAASVWLGGLWPLWLASRNERAGAIARRFSLMAIMAVAFIAASAFQQGAALFGGLPGLVGTDYGHTALVKLSLLLVLLAIASVNRFVLTPAVDTKPLALRELRASVVVETMLGACVVMAASRLASLPPGVHLQPDWPFAWRPSLDVLADPGLRREVLLALGALTGAALLVVLGIAARRALWISIVGAVVIAAFAVPHLSLLLVPAYPTSFYTSLTDFDSYGIAQGGRLFARNCVACHGADGRGDGPLAHSLDIPPADLTAEHVWAHTDGELFWYLTHGMDNPRGGLSMPGFGGLLGGESRWLLIDYLRAHNAGVALAERGGWNHPIPAPELEAVCGDGKVVALENFRGKVVRIVVGPPAAMRGLPTIFIDPSRPAEDTCVASAPEVWLAYAIVTGTTPAALAGSTFLVDPVGWLRARLRPSVPPPDLDALARRIIANPIVAPAGVGHHH
jgi:putative copper export protein/mono/diheme cytochrome c family protein